MYNVQVFQKCPKLIIHFTYINSSIYLFQAFISCNLDDYDLQVMKTQNSVSEKFKMVKKLNIKNSRYHILISRSTQNTRKGSLSKKVEWKEEV